MKLKIETIEEKEKKGDGHLLIGIVGIILLFSLIVFNFLAFVRWEYPLWLLRFTIGVLVINAFIFIRIE